MNKLRVALVQANLAWDRPEFNIEHCQSFVANAVENGANLIVLPEVFTTGFSFATGDKAKHAGDVARAFLADVARIHGVWIGGSVPYAEDGDYSRPYNTFFLHGPNGAEVQYRKRHLFSFAKEDARYRAGDEVVSFQIGEWRVTPLICYDLRFAKTFVNKAPSTDLFLLCANWPQPRRHHWRTLLTARAIDSQAYVVGVNRVGEGGGLMYSGDSLVVSPRGELLLDMHNREGVEVCELYLSEVEAYRAEFPSLRDSRD